MAIVKVLHDGRDIFLDANVDVKVLDEHNERTLRLPRFGFWVRRIPFVCDRGEFGGHREVTKIVRERGVIEIRQAGREGRVADEDGEA